MTTLVVSNAWNGEYEDGGVPAPGYKMGLAYTIQVDDGSYVWGLFSGTSMHLVASGTTETVDGARTAIEARAALGRRTPKTRSAAAPADQVDNEPSSDA